jgi:hypothetical protein
VVEASLSPEESVQRIAIGQTSVNLQAPRDNSSEPQEASADGIEGTKARIADVDNRNEDHEE